jgi:predicted O-methyltransferase YrrM
MGKLQEITDKYSSLPYMTHEQAIYLKDIIAGNKFKSICELGHFHGKGSVYIGSILEEQGFGKLTTYDIIPTRVTPNIQQLVEEFSLSDFVEPVVTMEGYVWDLAELIRTGSKRFDFCYIDGGHTFESTTIAFILIDLLLDKNGIVIFDDYNWTLESNILTNPGIFNIPMYRSNTEKQRKTPPIKMVCDLVVPNYNYTLLEIVDRFGWAVFQKN